MFISVTNINSLCCWLVVPVTVYCTLVLHQHIFIMAQLIQISMQMTESSGSLQCFPDTDTTQRTFTTHLWLSSGPSCFWAPTPSRDTISSTVMIVTSFLPLTIRCSISPTMSQGNHRHIIQDWNTLEHPCAPQPAQPPPLMQLDSGLIIHFMLSIQIEGKENVNGSGKPSRPTDTPC